MEIKLKNGLTRNIAVDGQTSGLRIESVKLNSKDVADIAAMGDKAAEYLELLSTRMACRIEE